MGELWTQRQRCWWPGCCSDSLLVCGRLQLEASRAQEAAVKQQEHEQLVAAIQAEEAAAAREAEAKRARQQQELQYRSVHRAMRHVV